MRNGTASTPAGPSGRPIPATIDRPLGTLPVSYDDAFGVDIRRLDNVATGTYVTARGTVTTVNIHGTDTDPRATVILTSSVGESAVLLVRRDPTRAGLIPGEEVTVQGLVARPVPYLPPFIQVGVVLPFDDVSTF